MSTLGATRADLFAPATGSGTPLESERRVETGKSSGLVGVGGLLDTVQLGDNVAVLATLPAECIDLVVTSPPYDDLRTYGGHSWDFAGAARELARVLKPGGVIVWVVADATVNGSETLTSMRQAIHFKDVCGLNVWDTMIWDKPWCQYGDTASRYAGTWEYCFVFSNGKPNSINILRDRPNVTAGTTRSTRTDRRVSGDALRVEREVPHLVKEASPRKSIWCIPKGETTENGGVSHPAPFPERLAADHILSWSNPGDVVLDPFAGSGTTLKAAKELNRHWLGIEINPAYVEICRARLAQDVLMLFPAGGGGAELAAKDSCDSPKSPNAPVSDAANVDKTL